TSQSAHTEATHRICRGSARALCPIRAVVKRRSVTSDIMRFSHARPLIGGSRARDAARDQENGVMPVLRVALAQVDITVGDLAAGGFGDVGVVIGYVGDDAGPRNALAFCFGGQVVSTYFKYHLPNYGVFDEARYFVPGTRFEIVRFRGVDVALTICEDLWQE